MILSHRLQKRKKNISDATWSYEYGMRLRNTVSNTTKLEDVLKTAGEDYSICVSAKIGRSTSSSRVNGLPQVFIDMVTDRFNEDNKETALKNLFNQNMDAVLCDVGKSGSSVNNTPKTPSVMMGTDFLSHIRNIQTIQQPTFPTLEDMLSVRPDIIDRYKNIMSDGTKLVVFNPSGKITDEWGFSINDISASINLIKTGEIRFIIKDDFCHSFYEIDGEHACFIGFPHNIKKILEKEEGSKFNGWDRTKQYRYTKEEISNMVKGKIFKFRMDLGGISRSMGSGFLALSIGG